MCAIAGVLHLDGRPCDPDDVRLITDAQRHRGPDGHGVHVEGSLGLGHRRLAILDLTDAGRQPMEVMNGRYWITYNGEVYNFVELRGELEAAGHRFVSRTDTEVIAAAYHHWGPDGLLKFNGMWAFAIWDALREELFLSRDRFGIKPLHYLAEPRRFVFASELKAFRHLPDFTPRENRDEIRRALATGRESTVDTLLEGVKMLPAGHNLRVGRSGVTIWRWWQTLDHVPEVPRRFSDQVEQFKDLFFSACRLRLRSDVPIATCLSGGLDSSSILCTIAAMRDSSARAGEDQRLSRDHHRAFVATFPRTPQDERDYADAAIVHAQAEPRYRNMDAELVIDDLKQYAFDFETIGSVLLVPVWRLYRELRRDGVVVSLDGQGADELLAGYPFGLRGAIGAQRSFWHAPLRALDLANTIAMEHGDGFGRYREVANIIVDSDPLLRTARGVAGGARRFARSLLVDAARNASARKPYALPPTLGVSVDIDGDERAARAQLTPLNHSLYAQFHNGILPSILRKYDRLAMSHGIESRMPFMDWRLVCLSFALPDASKAGHGMTKRILREAMRGVLPERVRTRRRKIGFRSPMQSWFNRELGDWVRDQVLSPQFLQSDLWDGPAIRDLVLAHHAARSWTEHAALRIWPFLQAHLWRQVFLRSEKQAP